MLFPTVSIRGGAGQLFLGFELCGLLLCGFWASPGAFGPFIDPKPYLTKAVWIQQIYSRSSPRATDLTTVLNKIILLKYHTNIKQNKAPLINILKKMKHKQERRGGQIRAKFCGLRALRASKNSCPTAGFRVRAKPDSTSTLVQLKL